MPGSGNGHSERIEHNSPAPDGGLNELRHLLVGPERDRLSALEQRLNSPAGLASEVGAVLPQSIRLSTARDGRLRTALEPIVTQAIRSSVQKDPSIVANTLYPVIGPAIRKAVAAALGRIVESLNQTLEYSLSLRSLKWRFEALRTGKPYGEIVLARSLHYSVCLVFLIHRKTGLLLQQASSESHVVREPELVSAMLTAVQDFVSDSFEGIDLQELEVVQVGEFNVWVQHGPMALIAAVIRGTPIAALRSRIELQLETIHRELSAALDDFNGDAAPFGVAKPHLEACLVGALQDRPGKRNTAVWAISIAAIALLAVWMFLSYRAQTRFETWVERMRTEPGFVVTAAERHGTRYTLAGLRDPLSRDPAQVTAEMGVPASNVEFRLEPYQSLRPEFVNARRLEDLMSDLKAETIGFATGKSNFEPGTIPVLRRIAFDLQALVDTARESGRSVHVDVIGSTDPKGSAETNVELAQQRADAVIAALVEMGFDRNLFGAGRAESSPMDRDKISSDPASQRHAILRVSLSKPPR